MEWGATVWTISRKKGWNIKRAHQTGLEEIENDDIGASFALVTFLYLLNMGWKIVDTVKFGKGRRAGDKLFASVNTSDVLLLLGCNVGIAISILSEEE